jgi:protein O-mannosyl-transferase
MWENIKKNKGVAVFIVFLIIGLAVYANSFGNQFFWDDNDEIVNNVYVQHFDVGKMFSENMVAGAGMTTNYYRPVLLLTYAIDYKIWGLNSFGFNLVDVLLHILNAWLIFVLLYFLLSLRGVPPRDDEAIPAVQEKRDCFASLAMTRVFWLAFLPALIFLVHPLNTEAVDYLSGRADVMYTFFLLLALIFYYQASERNDSAPRGDHFRASADKEFFNFFQAKEKNKKIINYSAVILFFFLSLLTKETAIVLPALAALLELFFLADGDWLNRIKTAAKNTWPLFLILAIYLSLHFTVFNFSHIAGAPIGCQGDYCSYGIFQRLLVFGLVVLNYFQILFVPLGQHMERAVTEFGSIYSWKVLAAAAAILLWLAAAIVFWKKEKGIAFGFFWFFILLLPTSGIAVKILYPTYEHFLYLPMIGFWLAILCLIYLFFDKVKNIKVLPLAKIFFCVMLIACVVFWGVLTIRRNRIWREPITFYENNLKYSPQSFIEHTNLGIAYDEAGRVNEAIAQYRAAISIADVYPQVHYDLANSLVTAKQYDEAEKEYLKTIAMDPGFTLPYRNLYNLYGYLGEKDKADEILKKISGNN